eukprot:TRINITY_DN18345_c0_g1_i1.p1 TRINITY_DN18345_c0_g1~~TRINITY_DN18345_c0_g1_i1.p1  ORF type:complete len:292 (-),score=33.51 TRINITY_DN18345_c0_g1_i1:805-1680(-)
MVRCNARYFSQCQICAPGISRQGWPKYHRRGKLKIGARVAAAGAPQLPDRLPLDVDGELRMRLCVAMATREDHRLADQRAKKTASRGTKRKPSTLSLRSGEWQPRWTVLRGRDAFPGQDLGRPVSIEHLARAKQFCEARGLAGIVVFGRMVYLRQQSAEALRAAAQPAEGADLLLRSKEVGQPQSRPPADRKLRVAVLATQDEFDETSLFDMGMVSTTGNGRRYAAQALLREILTSADLELSAVLVYDWKNSEDGKDSEWPVPLEGPERVVLALRGTAPVTAWRGTMGQLL